MIDRKFYRNLTMPLLVTSLTLLGGCADNNDTQAAAAQPLSLDLALPDSLTGGVVTANRPVAFKSVSRSLANKAGTGEPCSFMGNENEDELFDNGYTTTRFLVSTLASWTCIADLVIDISETVPHDGVLVETDNDTQSADYDPSEPTHYSISDDSDTQVTARMYYGYDRSSPPTQDSVEDFFISWVALGEDQTEGRLVINTQALDGQPANPDDPIKMRMDFNFNAGQKSADMFLLFDNDNRWADGMRLEIHKDLTASPLGQVYTARGIINMKGQFLPVNSISEIPVIQLYAVADQLGNGASIEEIMDMSLPLEMNAQTGNHLGNYLFTKKDLYFFKDDSSWEYIHKTITAASYRGGRATAASGGSWVPFNPSLDMIIGALDLDAGYFNGAQCGELDSSCVDLLNAVFADGFAEQEKNQGTDPQDWRSQALENAQYLDSVYPNGLNWEGAFDLVFTP